MRHLVYISMGPFTQLLRLRVVGLTKYLWSNTSYDNANFWTGCGWQGVTPPGWYPCQSINQFLNISTILRLHYVFTNLMVEIGITPLKATTGTWDNFLTPLFHSPTPYRSVDFTISPFWLRCQMMNPTSPDLLTLPLRISKI